MSSEEPIEIPINGELDLHTFRPNEIGDLVPDYLQACRAQGILQVRVIHGKGSGSLRRGVHALLARLNYVASYQNAPEWNGGWGATMVFLKCEE
ncbi:MAG: Smr/MutS family protein [Verrucomicrobiota bacterium]|jgi:DNA-nicking Smr family endonuclease|nr:Smr/MutS family protein [Verrucomicrobiota bacterium]